MTLSLSLSQRSNSQIEFQILDQSADAVFFYKIIAKVLTNRLKKVLPMIISPNHGAFIPGKLITDNILVAYETLHTLNTKKKGRASYMALKFDMSKAYN